MNESNERFVKIDILESLISSDTIITHAQLQKELEEMKNEALLKNHPYAIWQGKDGRWFTHLVDKDGKRVTRVRKTEKELQKEIIKFYKSLEENPTVNQLFQEWMDRKTQNEDLAPATDTRYRGLYKTYFEPLRRKKIRNVRPVDIEDFVYYVIHEFGLSRKEFNGVRTVLYGIFRLARRKELFPYDIQALLADLQIPNKVFAVKHKEDREQVFFPEEEEKLIAQLRKKHDVRNLGLELLFKTGLRIGELAALKPSDITGNVIHITRTETKYIKDGKHRYEIVDRPKTEAGVRDVVIKDDALEIIHEIRRINPFGEWLFMDRGKRLTQNCFRQRLYRECDKAGVPRRSPHKIRKTYGTKLYDSDLPASFICNQMGHTDIRCLEKYYYFNRMTKEDKLDALNKISAL